MLSLVSLSTTHCVHAHVCSCSCPLGTIASLRQKLAHQICLKLKVTLSLLYIFIPVQALLFNFICSQLQYVRPSRLALLLTYLHLRHSWSLRRGWRRRCHVTLQRLQHRVATGGVLCQKLFHVSKVVWNWCHVSRSRIYHRLCSGGHLRGSWGLLYHGRTCLVWLLRGHLRWILYLRGKASSIWSLLSHRIVLLRLRYRSILRYLGGLEPQLRGLRGEIHLWLFGRSHILSWSAVCALYIEPKCGALLRFLRSRLARHLLVQWILK